MFTRLIVGICLACAGIAVPATAAELPPIRAFVQPRETSRAKLSPDGTLVAMVTQRDFLQQIVTINLKSMAVQPAVSLGDDIEILQYLWKGNDSLLVQLLYRDGTWAWRQVLLKTGKVNDLHAFNRDGAHNVVHTLPEDAEHVLFSYRTVLVPGVELRRYNLRTGKSEVTEKNPGSIQKWLVNDAGQAVAALGHDKDDWFVLFRRAADGPWERRELGRKFRPTFRPMAVHSDQRRIVGIDSGTSDTSRGVVWDPASGAEEIVFTAPIGDVNGVPVWGGTLAARGFTYSDDRDRVYFFDAGLRKLAEEIDEILPTTNNTIASSSKNHRRLLIESSAPNVPPRYSLLDLDDGSLRTISASYRELPPTALSPRRAFTCKATDGLIVHAKLTTPASAGTSPPPVILAIATSLHQRMGSGFSPTEQLFANRGYATLEVDPRGTEGYGTAFAAAGDGQLLDGVVQDVLAALEHAAAQQWIDRKRVVVLGQGYPGLVALKIAATGDVAAWVNWNTPMHESWFSLEDMELGSEGRNRDYGWFRYEDRLKYARSIDPIELSTRVRIPSFHYYHSESSGDSLMYNGTALESVLRRNAGPYVLLRSPKIRRDADSRQMEKKNFEEQVRVLEGVFKFLEQHLPRM